MLDAVEDIAPGRLVYVSCNPETLSKDLDVLRTAYKVEKIQPVDMFPRTQHCEVVVKLKRTKA